MSTATDFKYYRAFPFCAENMLAASVAALPFAKLGPYDLTQAMAFFWNLESVDLSYGDTGGIGSETGRPILSDDDASSDFGSTSTEPMNRVCAPEQMADGDYGARSATPLFSQTSVAITNGNTEYFVIFRLRRVIYATDTDKYWLVISVIIQLDGDGGNKAGTTDLDDPECTVLSSNSATFDAFAFDFNLRSDVADTGTFASVESAGSWTY